MSAFIFYEHWVAGALALALAANGARMSSTADDVFAEIRSAAWRLASVRLLGVGLLDTPGAAHSGAFNCFF